jgi:hypothetical protein
VKSWWQLTLALGKTDGKEEAASAGDSFYMRRRAKEEMTVVPHISDDQPMACRSGGDAVRVGFPCPGSLTGGPRSVFSNPTRDRMGMGHTVPRSGPLIIGFLFFQTKLNL